jgi:hypothetical protein
LLNEIKCLVGLSENDFWKDLPSEVKQAINHAKDQLDRGEGVPHKQVMDEIKSRFLHK